MRHVIEVVFLLAAQVAGTSAAPPPLLPEPVVNALASETSGEAAKLNLEFLTRQHRMRGSVGFRAAAEHIVSQLHAAGLDDAYIIELPADGTILYGSQRSRPPWDAQFAELWELADHDGKWDRSRRLANWSAQPVTLAEDSESADVTADLIDIGAGLTDADYEGIDVRGKLVLTSSQPGAIQEEAVGRRSAVGIVSSAQNQHTAWWKEDENLIRWGHLKTFSDTKTFAFMVSLKEARSFQDRLNKGQRVRLHATVRAGQHPGAYSVVTATIPGVDPALRDEEIVFSCHLDHQRPGANDNASGASAILEVARTLQKLINEGRIPPPRRTIRFVWPPEIEGTLALLNGHPELTANMKAAIHMDMVGGGPATKAVFHITRGPQSLPSFIHDVAATFGAYVNDQTDRYASGESVDHPLTAPTGGKEPLRAALVENTMGSDHDVYNEGSFRIPAIYFNDWPDRYIHTNADSAANIDPTKLKRAAFLGAACGYYLATLDDKDAPNLWNVIKAQSLRRVATTLEQMVTLDSVEQGVLARHTLWREQEIFQSISQFINVPASIKRQSAQSLQRLAATLDLDHLPESPVASGVGAIVYTRNAEPKGPMSVFGYDYLLDHLGDENTADALRLRRYTGARADGGAYAYEALNLVNGSRTVQAIRDDLSATFGPVDVKTVAAFLQALNQANVLDRVR